MTDGENFGDASDKILLRQYVKQRSEAAFAQMMRRHYSLVYSTCKREVGDADLAEDVSQAVFMILARRASTLRGGTGLAGWLFQTARFASKNALRQERRRIQREQKGQEMLRQEPPKEEALSSVWETVEPHLHTVLSRLTPDDREAILLRFFEECSFAEIGMRLEVSDNTARMRVTRALEKMRRHLGHAGIALTTALIATLLTQKAPAAAPAVALSKTIPTGGPHILGQAAVHFHYLMQGVVAAMKIKTSAAIAAVIALLLITGASVFLVKRHQSIPFSPQEAVNLRRAPFSSQEAANFRVDVATTFANNKSKSTDAMLKELASRQRNPYLKGVVLQVDDRLGAGDPMMEALAKSPEVFNQDFLSMCNQAEHAKSRSAAIVIIKQFARQNLN